MDKLWRRSAGPVLAFVAASCASCAAALTRWTLASWAGAVATQNAQTSQSQGSHRIMVWPRRGPHRHQLHLVSFHPHNTTRRRQNGGREPVWSKLASRACGVEIRCVGGSRYRRASTEWSPALGGSSPPTLLWSSNQSSDHPESTSRIRIRNVYIRVYGRAKYCLAQSFIAFLAAIIPSGLARTRLPSSYDRRELTYCTKLHDSFPSREEPKSKPTSRKQSKCVPRTAIMHGGSFGSICELPHSTYLWHSCSVVETSSGRSECVSKCSHVNSPRWKVPCGGSSRRRRRRRPLHTPCSGGKRRGGITAL